MTSDELERARTSFAKRSWGVAHKELAAADASSPLHIEDLERLGVAAYMSGDDEKVADLTDRQREDFVRVLDGMVRERSGGNGAAVLTAPLNIGVGTK